MILAHENAFSFSRARLRVPAERTTIPFFFVIRLYSGPLLILTTIAGKMNINKVFPRLAQQFSLCILVKYETIFLTKLQAFT